MGSRRHRHGSERRSKACLISLGLLAKLYKTQARKRLKGRGFGVKRVEAAGNNRAVVVHTAAGSDLTKLERLFHDVRVAPPGETGAPDGIDFA